MSLAFVRTTPLFGGVVSGTPKLEKARLYVDFFESEGYQARVDKDGDVVFKRDGYNYFIGVDENDRNFFQVVLPAFWKIESAADREKAQDAINYANSRTKTAKGYIVKNSVWVSVEIFVDSPESFRPVFSRCLSALHGWAKNFVSQMEPAEPIAPAPSPVP